MSQFWQSFVPVGIAGVLGALTATIGTLYVQRHLQRYNMRTKRMERLGGDFREFSMLAASYWTAKANTRKHKIDHTRIRARKDLLVIEFGAMAKRHKRIEQAFNKSHHYRLDLWEAAMGGSFEETETKWQPERYRVPKILTAVGPILELLVD